MNPFELFFQADVLLSTRILVLADVICGLGVLASLVSILFHAKPTADGSRPSWIARAPLLFVVLATVTIATAVGFRWVEVNHFPSQTMAEVLSMFTLSLGVSMIVLWFVLNLRKRGHNWAIVEDVLVLLIFVGIIYTHGHIRTLATAQRDLPPALQSWWFAPHLSCLIFSYATMGIAALLALVYFLTRFWSGVWRGGQSWQSQAFILAGLVLVPFAHLVTIPMLLVSGLVFAGLLALGRVPGPDMVLRLEKDLDDVSFRAFAVGFPFLTAGLWQGAFWAQEAWANYWGWDSKENSALITWLVYVIYIHLRLLGGYRGAKAMSALVAGALSVFLTFQVFGYLPDSQKSLHRYTDDGVEAQEGQQGAPPAAQQARADSSEAGAVETR